MVTNIFIKLIILGLILGLTGYVFFTGHNLTCDNCIVNFHSTKDSFNSANFSYKLSDLYEESKDGGCPVFWSRTQGYVKG